MNPVVLLVTHERIYITAKNIESILKQSTVPKIVLVCSTSIEYKTYTDSYPEVTVIQAPNKPLGLKFQAGVEVARKFKPNPLIITGSDDILEKDYIAHVCRLLEQGYHFIGLKKWYVYDQRKNKMHLFNYNTQQCLGGGRAYSAELLEKMRYEIFDSTRIRHLDDLGYFSMLKSRMKRIEIEEPFILSVKGDWVTMNPIEKMLGHTNCKPVQFKQSVKEIFHQFNYHV